MRSDLLEGGAKPLLDRVRAMAEREQLDRNKEALRLLENDLVFHSGRMNDRERLAAGLAIGSGLQKFDRGETQADRGKVETRKREPNGETLGHSLRRTVE